jgi:hypothetical protein
VPRRTVGLFACASGGLAYGVLLAWLASAAAGYGGDSHSLSLVLLFMAGFPVSLPLCGFGAYFIALAPPIFWTLFGVVLSFSAPAGRARRVGGRLLFLHYIGVFIGLLAVPWAVESSAHMSAKSIAGVVLGLLVYLAGQIAWWRALPLLDRLAEGPSLSGLATGSPQLGRLAAGVLALLAAGVILNERAELTVACSRAPAGCEIERVGRGAFKRKVPVEEVSVRFAVPQSRLEVGTESQKETLISVACGDRLVGGNMFNRCESRGGRILAALDAFLNRKGTDQVRIVDEDPWPAGAVAAVLGALGLWLFASSLVTVRSRRTLPPRSAVPAVQRGNRGR